MSREKAVDPQFTREELTGLLTSIGGSHARRLTPVEVGELLAREHRRGVTTAQLAEALNLHPGASVITWFLRLPDLPEDVQGLVQFGRPRAGLSLTQAAEVARLRPDVGAMRELARRAVEEQLTGRETRSVVQLIERRGVSVSEAVDDVLEGRPLVERRHVYIGAVDSALSARIEGMPADSRNELLADVLRSIDVASLDAVLGPRRYTLVFDETQKSHTDVIGLDAETLERAINRGLEERL